MGGELIRRGYAQSSELWSAQALLDAPLDVVNVHKDFVQAGAQIIITNSYSTIPSYLGKLDLAHRYQELTGLAAQLARQVAQECGGQVQVAGSLPPLSESYRPDLVAGVEEARPIYRNLVSALQPFVDLYICETMSSIDETLNAATMAFEQDGTKPVYVSWTLAEEPGSGLRSGESIADAVNSIAHLDVTAILFNCTTPEAVEVAIGELRGLTDKPIGAYPNLLRIPQGWTLDDKSIPSVRRELSVEEFVLFAQRYIDAGASILGGCCGIGPEYIAALKHHIS